MGDIFQKKMDLSNILCRGVSKEPKFELRLVEIKIAQNVWK